jgi:hypothetical protein
MMSLIAVALMSVVNAGEPAKCSGATCSATPRKVVTVTKNKTRTHGRIRFEQEYNGKVPVPDAWFPWKPNSTDKRFNHKKRCCR